MRGKRRSRVEKTPLTLPAIRELGVAVNPYLFRDCAVYTVATTAGHCMGIAFGLLKHIDRDTTERHYNKGASLDAVRRYQQFLDQLIGN